jgi:heptosyltransferase-3
MAEKKLSGGLFQRRILIVRQDRIGDVVLSTGLPRELKKRWPDCHVAVLVRGYTADLFENNPHVDEIITDDFRPETRNSSFWRMVGKLRRRRFSHALMLLPQARYNYMTFCAGIPFRIGHGIILFHALTAVWPVMTRKFKKGRHEAEYSLDLVRAMGVRTDNAAPEIHLSGEEAERVAQLRAARSGLPAVGLHVTSGKSAPNWEPGNWVQLAGLLRESGRVQVVITDHELPGELLQTGGPERPELAMPNLGQPLRVTATTIASLDLLVSASTGPMHMAGALNVPTLSLFCPKPACEPALWGPLGNRAEFIMPEEEHCRDRCPGSPHICDYSGSAAVTPEKVARRILAQISSSS